MLSLTLFTYSLIGEGEGGGGGGGGGRPHKRLAQSI